MSTFELDPDRFVPGTVGPPGARVFYLQAILGPEVISLKLEKQQVVALAEYLAGILADLPPPDQEPDDLDLAEPVLPEWVVGSLGVAYDNDADRMLVVAEELVEVDEEQGEPVRSARSARFRLTRGQVAAFVRQAVRLVQAGRPPCRICGMPMDPDGHVCPRNN